MNHIERLLPYLLFLPLDLTEKQEFIRIILAPKVAAAVLSSFDKDGRVLQRNLIEDLPYSNKSILSYLSSLKKVGLVTSGTTVYHGKRVVYHDLTKTGWSLARVFFEGLPSDVHELTSYLLEDYLTHLVTLFQELGISSSTLFDVFTKARSNALLSGSAPFDDPTFLVFGAAAYFTKIECAKIPSPNSSSSCETPKRFPGGPTISLVNSLTESEHNVSLVSTVGNDQDGWNLISDLIRQNVDIGDISVVDGKNTNETIVIDDQKGSRSLIGVGPDTALSITSPEQVPWLKLEKAKVVYIGEVFSEVAATISVFAKSNQIPVVYRCSVPFLERGLDQLEPILRNIDILILSNHAWSYLKKSIRKDPLTSLRTYTDATIVIRNSPTTYIIQENQGKPITQSTKSDNLEISGDFSANLLIGLSEGKSAKEAVTKAIKSEAK
ncbi:MAG: carbohydrate kinase family protein [Candidatus Thorarchaeota archaeon]